MSRSVSNKKGKIYVHPYVDVRILAGVYKLARKNGLWPRSLSDLAYWAIKEVNALSDSWMSVEEAYELLAEVKPDVAFMRHSGNSLPIEEREELKRGLERDIVEQDKMFVGVGGIRMTLEQKRQVEETKAMLSRGDDGMMSDKEYLAMLRGERREDKKEEL